MENNDHVEYIGNVKIDLQYYNGNDLYNEGDEAENLVLETLKQGVDPLKALSENDKWAVLYQLSPTRKNIVSVMNISKSDRVLEIGAGMGAISGALAELADSVDCIDLSKRRSYANAYRNKNCNNLNIYVGNFEDIKLTKKYDIVVIIGVLEYAGSFINNDKPYDKFLEYICNYLNENGKVYIAIENRFGMKYFAGCAEDHLGKPFAGIEGYDTNKVKTFSYSEICSMLNKYFKELYFYYPFPDYKMPSVIYSQDYLPNETANLKAFKNYDTDRLITLDEEKAYKHISTQEDWNMFTNSFLIEALKK